MHVTVHRGTGQIGGNLVEIGAGSTRLLFDAGAKLPPLDEPQSSDDFALEGLTHGVPAFDRVFISHHHHDHCGLIGRLLPGIPVFAGRETTRVLHVIADFINQPRPAIAGHFHSGRTMQAGDLRVTPLRVDHSSREAYMFLVQAGGKSVLYTGDYRDAAHIPGQIAELLGGRGLDLLISEGTNIRQFGRGPRTTLRDERTIEEAAVPLMKQYDGTVFVLCSSTNEDRVQSIRRAAERAGRIVCEDLFQASVRGQADEGLQRFVASYVDENDTPRSYAYFRALHAGRELVGAETLAGMPGKKAIFVRTSMEGFIGSYLRHCPGGRSLLIYSMWQGYKSTGRVRRFLDFCGQKGLDVADLHCSGHAYFHAIRALIKGLAPAALLPIHCEAAERKRFQTLHPNCLTPGDGVRIEI